MRVSNVVGGENNRRSENTVPKHVQIVVIYRLQSDGTRAPEQSLHAPSPSPVAGGRGKREHWEEKNFN